MSAEPSPKFLLTDTLLEGQLADLMRQRRQAGDSWDLVARAVWQATDGKVTITGVTAAKWFDRFVGVPSEAGEPEAVGQ